MATFDVVIVAYNSRDAIGGCIASLSRLPGLGRVVAVDHGRDGSADVAEAAGAVVVRNPENPGFGAGQNRGVAETSAPYVLLLNPDAEVDAAGVVAGLAVLDDEPDVAAVQGVIVNRSTGAAERSQGVELGPVHLLGRAVGARRLLASPAVRAFARRVGSLADHAERVPAGPTDVESLAATALLVRRAAYREVGGFDQSYFLYGEDLDLCRRLRAAGWRLVALPDAWAVHTSGGSAPTSWSRETSWWAGTMRFAARWWDARSWSVAVLAAAIRAARLTVKHPRSVSATWGAMVAAPVRERRLRRFQPRPVVDQPEAAAAVSADQRVG